MYSLFVIIIPIVLFIAGKVTVKTSLGCTILLFIIDIVTKHELAPSADSEAYLFVNFVLLFSYLMTGILLVGFTLLFENKRSASIVFFMFLIIGLLDYSLYSFYGLVEIKQSVYNYDNAKNIGRVNKVYTFDSSSSLEIENIYSEAALVKTRKWAFIEDISRIEDYYIHISGIKVPKKTEVKLLLENEIMWISEYKSNQTEKRNFIFTNSGQIKMGKMLTFLFIDSEKSDTLKVDAFLKTHF